MYEYMQKIKNIANNLATIGNPISDEDLIMHLLT